MNVETFWSLVIVVTFILIIERILKAIIKSAIKSAKIFIADIKYSRKKNGEYRFIKAEWKG